MDIVIITCNNIFTNYFDHVAGTEIDFTLISTGQRRKSSYIFPIYRLRIDMTAIIKPPFTFESARAKVQMAEDLWNTKDPEKVAMAYTEDTVWRNRHEFLQGRAEIISFLSRKWQKELDYRLTKELFLFSDDKIAVQFEYKWHDAAGQRYRSYGIENWEFANDGRMKKRTASINDIPIDTLHK